MMQRWQRFPLIALPLLVALTARPQASVQQPGSSQPPTQRAGIPDAGGDLQLIRSQHFSDPGEFAHYRGAGNTEHALENRRHSFIARYNPVSLVLKGSLFAYQKIVSRQLARQCPYEITCSNFSKLAIEEFGIFKGIFISADRIMRCNRIGLLDVPPLSVNPATGAIIDPPNLYR